MRLRRHPERARTDRPALDAVLDAGWLGTLAVAADGHPQVVPVLYARDGDAIVLHGSTGAGTLRLAADGRPVAFCVAHLDAFVYAASLFHSSANYRSAVVHGHCEVLAGAAAQAGLDALGEHLMPGRAAEVRAPTPKELAATLVLRLPILEGGWVVKARTGPPGTDDDEQLPPVWTGVLPVHQVLGEPVGAEPGIPVSPSVLRRR